MIALSKIGAEHWIDLGHGVEVRVRPRSRALIAHAMADDTLDGLSPERHPHAYGVALAAALARVAILDWRGVGDTEGEPIAPGPAAIDELMTLDWAFEAWADAYVAPVEAEMREKNASAPSPNGISAGAPTIAPPAQPGATDAPSE